MLLRKTCGLPRLFSKKHNLPAGFQQPKDRFERLRVAIVTQNRRANHVIEALGGQFVETLDHPFRNAWDRLPILTVCQVGVKYDSRNLVLIPENSRQFPGP
jgi:hypothetical protein